ncbi:transporter [Hansschlegelia zhihuaiae]|uniref:Transporter n=2 Tax=Hansschlegelia zhihuaiae TaxID=405005 RepID=A0A4Q0MNR1_9HYPH|nr:transporter [Hansschlegelia zhihuaiae]
MYRRRRRLLSGVVTLAALVASHEANAGAFALREQSATGQGMSFAGMAAGGGDSLSGMFWNPAVVNQVEHLQGEQHLSFIAPSSKIEVSDATKGLVGALGGTPRDGGDIGEYALLGASYSAYRVSDQVSVGLSINTPFGLATDPHHNWAGQTYARSSQVRSINAAPTVGYQVNDWLSIAGGVQIQYFDIQLRQALGLPQGSQNATLTGDDIGVGFTAGMTIAPVEGTSVGVGFRSSIEHKLKGNLSVPGPNVKIKAEVDLPEQVTIGLRQRVTEDLTLLAGGEWTNWSRLDSVAVKARTGGATVTTLPFGYKDGWFVSGGAEYRFTPALTGRAGVAYEWSPITDKVRSNRLPDDDRWWLSAGGSYNHSDRLAFDLGYSYIFVPGKSKIDIKAGDPDFVGLPYSAKSKSEVHIVSAAVRYKFGGDAPAALVTKY